MRSGKKCCGALAIASCAMHSGIGSAFPAEPTLEVPYAISATQTAPVAARPDAARGQLVLYAIKVNGQDFDVTPILRLEGGVLYARRAEFESWRLETPAGPAVTHNGEEYFPLQAQEGYRAQVDNARQTLVLEFAPLAFAPTLLGLGAVKPAIPVLPGWGGFANYDLSGLSTKTQSGRASRIDGVFEAGMYTPHGVLVTSALGRSLARNATASDGSEAGPRLIRLETTWTHDSPGEARSLQLGDSIGTGGIWGRPVRYGGVHWGTNFATQPGFVTAPLPAIGGQAALPSTAELYINGILRQRTALPPGPFQLNDLPAVTGQGEARLVVRDILGREQVITQPYYASSTLLKEGLSDDSYELGFVRENFGLRDNDYGPLAASATLRRGVTDRFTVELRGEVLREQRTAGIGASVVAPIPVVLTGAVAVSHGEAGPGRLLFIAAEHQSQGFGVGVRSQWATSSFTQLGLPPDKLAPRQQMSANLGFPLGSGGTLGIAYVRLLGRTQSDSEIAAASYTMRLGNRASLNCSGSAELAGARTRSIGITLVIALDERQSFVASHGAQSGAGQSLVQLQQGLPAGSGYGYRVLAATGASGGRWEAAGSMQTEAGTYGLDLGEARGITTVRLSAAGGLVSIGGRVMPSRRIGDAFAVVEVPDYPEVGIYVSNQLVARTDTQGLAVIPRLLPYQSNPVRVDPTELPLDAEIKSVQVDAVPYFRSGLALKFPVKRSSGALITLVLDDGGSMPLGAVVTVGGEKEEFPVAQRGEVYVTGLAAVNQLRGSWRGQSCTVSVELPADAGPVPSIGPLKCSGVRR